MNPSELPSISIILTGIMKKIALKMPSERVSNCYEGPVEIILSDDGSSDRTFAVMQEMVLQYDGPAGGVNRNETSRAWDCMSAKVSGYGVS